MAVGVLAGDERLEAVGDADVGEDPGTDLAVAAGDHRHGAATMAPPDDLHDRLDREHAVEPGEEIRLLAPGGLLDVDREARLARERGDDVAGRPAGEGVEAVLRERQPVGLGEILPGDEMHRHRVGERAVTIEEQRVGGLLAPHGGRRVQAGPGCPRTVDAAPRRSQDRASLANAARRAGAGRASGSGENRLANFGSTGANCPGDGARKPPWPPPLFAGFV